MLKLATKPVDKERIQGPVRTYLKHIYHSPPAPAEPAASAASADLLISTALSRQAPASISSSRSKMLYTYNEERYQGERNEAEKESVSDICAVCVAGSPLLTCDAHPFFPNSFNFSSISSVLKRPFVFLSVSVLILPVLSHHKPPQGPLTKLLELWQAPLH